MGDVGLEDVAGVDEFDDAGDGVLVRLAPGAGAERAGGPRVSGGGEGRAGAGVNMGEGGGVADGVPLAVEPIVDKPPESEP